MIGCKLRKLRYKNKLTQTDVAIKLGVDQSTLSHFENDKRKPDIYILKQLCNLYGCTMDSVLEAK